MGVGRYTPNAAVQGDTGWKPTIVRQWTTVLNQRTRLKTMDINRINSRIFEWAERNANDRCKNWNFRINKILEEARIDFHSDVTSATAIKEQLAGYLQQNFVESWSNDVNRENARRGEGRNKLRTYKTFKTDYKTENYLNCIMPRCHRSAYAKFRCGVAPIRIETGRYERLPCDLRKCFNCSEEIETEEHVLLACPLFQDLRETLFEKLVSEFPNVRQLTDTEKLSAILSCKDNYSIRICAKICHEILRKRRNILYQ